jgi:PTH1 family peptidyl-tRNA hydrolase
VKIIVGLGNPGIQYRMTRHNIGFHVIDRLAKISHIPFRIRRFKSLYGTGWIDSQKVALAKPVTFMNRSGEAVKKAVDGSNFLRLKVGIGRPPPGMDPAEYVLGTFDEAEQSQLDQILSRAAESLKVMLLEGLEKAMNQFQKKGR